MSSTAGPALIVLASDLQSLGLFDAVNTVEPKSAPGAGMFAAIFFTRMFLAGSESGLSQGTGVYVFTIRLYFDFLSEPSEEIDSRLISASDAIIDLLASGFTLGGNVRNVDLFGMSGESVTVRGGYVTISNVVFRVFDINVPLIINDSTTSEAA